MTILVTGGAGFIGSNFIAMLIRETTHTVVNLDLLTYAANPANCTPWEQTGRYRLIHGDIADYDLVDRLLSESVDVIVNFAAESHVDRSIHDSTLFVRTNILGTQVLLDAAKRHGIPRFIQISTDEVYGDLDEDEPPFTESSLIKPSSPYAASKAAADMLVMAAWRTHQQPVLITRCSNNYGPYQHPEKLIPLSILRAHRNEPIPIYGTGKNIRDWIHVDDHCAAILAALEQGKNGQVYNIGGHSEHQNIHVVQSILRLMDKNDDLIHFVTDRPGHDRRYSIDYTKAQNTLHWQPKIPFSDGLKQTVEWYLANPDWLKQMESANFQEFCKKHYQT